MQEVEEDRSKLKIIQIQSINQNMNSDYKSAWL